MNILAIDTSAKAAGCAVYRDGQLFAESFLNAGLTHSQTIMPMVRDMLACARMEPGDIDVFAVSAGPGSFTGLRIGISAVKGMAMAQNAPCAAVSTLEALAFNLAAFSGIIVPAMDARRSQVYTAIFTGDGRSPVRKTDDEAISIDELGEKLREFGETPVMLVGDGARLCYEKLRDRLPGLLIAPENMLYQRASGVCTAALGMAERGLLQTTGELEPVYLRLPQAERERLERSGEK